MPKEKACKKCKAIFTGSKCPKCGSEEHTETFKGKIDIINPEDSEIAKELKLKDKGDFAIRA
jgi:DNA-directed RNA polymerase subunit E"